MKMVMNTLTKKMAILGIAGACAAPVMADRAMYAGGGLGMAELGDDNDVTMPYGRFGMYINENFSGEVRAGLALMTMAWSWTACWAVMSVVVLPYLTYFFHTLSSV